MESFVLGLFLFASLCSRCLSLDVSLPPGVHFTIRRRGGAFSIPLHPGEVANMTFLSQQLDIAEGRFNHTTRKFSGNTVVRIAKDRRLWEEDHGKLLGRVGKEGSWRLGDPPQDIEMDLDMLTSDFFVSWTSSGRGSRFDDIFSKTYGISRDATEKSSQRLFPSCTRPREIVTIPLSNNTIPIAFPYCRPSKQVLDTLLPSGSMLGLAPASSLSQINAPGLIQQLRDAHIIESDMWSIMLLNGQEGVLTLGGTVAEVVKGAMDEIDHALDNMGRYEKHIEQERKKKQDEENGGKQKRGLLVQEEGGGSRDWKDMWKWTPVEGADGWWQVLLAGVWVDGVKVLKNHPMIIDLTTPFILAPPSAVRTFYSSIPGSRRLPSPHNAFFAYPCLNPPPLAFEFAGANFPVLKGPQDLKDRPWPYVGGKLSLGRIARGSGFCVGAVVENDRWVLGELGFRGLGMVFEGKRVGFRAY
ncbi:hypothetical protein NA57DRAFT_35284 [Rhizodiscina lignyota]|uniref:Peptidase A1 domain-containing protein n=1 Tax=Rhizodiscina lignyota TaxID=1504668 RepID=A0A9P4ILQ7_9PEZI|nr:hypothetical protein NA57DRAFT_35284 [Rhizodiscina lignyota]